MYGEPDPLYVRARSALLDTADTLEKHMDALILVGAQAVYLRTGNSDLAVAEHTTDADFAIGPRDLADEPLLGDLLLADGFTLRRNPGAWLNPDGIAIDFMVPEAMAGPGSRAARLGVHGKTVARRAKGLEGALIDRDRIRIGALDPADDRSIDMWVAGPAALLVAKVVKIDERVGGIRSSDKDALDVLRLLRGVATETLAKRLDTLRRHDLSRDVSNEAIDLLRPLFGTSNAEGVAMILRAGGATVDPEILSLSTTILVNDLLKQL